MRNYTEKNSIKIDTLHILIGLSCSKRIIVSSGNSFLFASFQKTMMTLGKYIEKRKQTKVICL